MRLLFCLFTIVVFSARLPSRDDLFEEWISKHNKVYTAEEKAVRFVNFQASVQRIAKSNANSGPKEAVFGLNQFSDLTPTEFKSTYLLKNFKPTPENQRVYFPTPRIAVPDSFDWRTKGVVTKVKDQGQCGSCWAFSATENIESVWMIAKKISNETMPPLAPQQIVDCDESDGGCDGGDTPTAYEYVKKAGGLESEKDYPYRAKDESCKFDKTKEVAHITGWKYATTKKDEKTMQANLVALSPLSICLDAENWQDYSSGVMSASQCARRVTLDHCVQVVGFDLLSNATKPYWIVRNSWGEDWGEKGYILLEYGQNTCGLTDEVTTATA